MTNKVQLKRSSVQGKVPQTTDLDLGELGINTYDGKAYIKKDDGTESIVALNPQDLSTSSNPTFGNVTVNSTTFNQTMGNITPTVGQVAWDDGNGTLQIGLKGGNVILQVGQEQILRVFNATASTLTDGQIVYVTGAQGNRPSVVLANANSELTSANTIGMVTEPIPAGAEGFITTNGMVNGLDTSAYAEGVGLWLSTTDGQFSTTRPTAPNHGVFIGWVVRQHATAGSIFVHVQNGYELDELHDVHITSVANDNALIYNSTNSRWENRLLTTNDIKSGTFEPTLLATGTPDATKFVRGDGVWAVPTTGQGGIGNILCYDSNNVQDDIQISAYDVLDTFTINNQLTVGKTMDILIAGGTYGWRDLFGGMDPRSGVSAPNWTVFRGGIYLYAFSATAVREVFATFHIDHDYAMGTVMYPHIHWTVNTTSSGTVRWGFEYTIAKGHQQATGSIYSAPTTVYVEQTVNGATDQYKHFVSEVSLADAIPATLMEPDTVILMRVFRDAAHPNDTYPDLAFGIQTDLHYQTARWATVNKSPNFYS